MTTHNDAMANTVLAANEAMRTIALNDQGYDDTRDELRKVWEPIAEALLLSEPDWSDWKELHEQAREAGDDYVGVTSDTREVVVWGEEHYFGPHRSWRQFDILKRA